METQATIDATDPAVVILAWVLTALVKKLQPVLERLGLDPAVVSAALPAVAVLMAVGARASIAAVEGEPFSLDVLFRALAAGATAVLLHSQVREAKKVAAKRKGKQTR